MSTVVERLDLLLTGNAKDAIAAIRQTQSAAVDLDTSTGQAQKKMGFLGAAAQTAGSHIQQNIGMYSVAAVGALTAAGASAVHEYTSLAGTIRDFQRSTGSSAETASRLVAVFDDLEISQEGASRAFFKLSREIGTGDSNLEQYGVKVARTKDGNVDLEETMIRVAEAYKTTSDQSQRAALIQEAFGRGGKDLIPILEQGRAGIERLFENVPDGQILSQEQIDRAREYELAVDNLGDSIQELKVAAGSELAPELTKLANGTAGLIRVTNDASGALDTLGGFGTALKDSVVNAIPGVGNATSVVGNLGKVFGWGKGESDQFADAQKRVGEASAEVARLSADESTKQSDLNAAQRELTAAKNDYEGVSRRVAAALTDETNAYATNRAEVQNFINAQLGVTGAQLNVEAATVRYNQTLAENGADALETRQAAQNLEQQYVALGAATQASALQAGKSQGEAAQAQVDALTWVAGTMAPGSPLRVWLDDYINRLQTGIPKTVTTRLQLQQAVQGFMTPGVDANGNPVLETFADGGVVPGAPGARRIIEAHGGEAIFNQDQLRALSAAGVGGGSGGGGGDTLVFHIYDATDPDRVMAAISRAVSNGSSVPPRVRAAFTG